MENLITKEINFEGIYNINQGEIELIQKYIESLKNPECKERLIEEARQFYANIFGVEKEDVYFGNINARTSNIENPFKFSHVIGEIDLSALNVDMSKLVYCCGLTSSGVREFKNLEIINGYAYLQGSRIRKSSIQSLPKLKYAHYIDCSNSYLKELGLENAYFVNLMNTTLEKINLKEVKEHLVVAYSKIQDISSLETVKKFNCRGTNITKINPDLKITGELQCENSNHFEEKLNCEQLDTWHIDQ